MREMKARSRSRKQCRARGFGYSVKKIHTIIGEKTSKCPYCGSPMELRSSKGIYKSDLNDAMLYVCQNYPVCDAYVRTIKRDNDYIPIGVPGNASLRALRNETHYYFDKLTECGILTRTESYKWLADKLQLKQFHAHIGDFSEYECVRTINEVVDILLINKEKTAGLVKPFLRRNHVTYTMKSKELQEKLSKLCGRVIYIEYPTKKIG